MSDDGREVGTGSVAFPAQCLGSSVKIDPKSFNSLPSDATGNVYITGCVIASAALRQGFTSGALDGQTRAGEVVHTAQESLDAAGNVYIAGEGQTCAGFDEVSLTGASAPSAYSRKIAGIVAQIEHDALSTWYQDGADAAAGVCASSQTFDISDAAGDNAMLPFSERMAFWGGTPKATTDADDAVDGTALSSDAAGNVYIAGDQSYCAGLALSSEVEEVVYITGDQPAALSADAAGSVYIAARALYSGAAGQAYISDAHHDFFMTGLLDGDTPPGALVENDVVLEDRDSLGVDSSGGLLGNSLEYAVDPCFEQCGGLQGTENLVGVCSKERESGGFDSRGGLLGNSLEGAGDSWLVQSGGLQGTGNLVGVRSVKRESGGLTRVAAF